jgi:hypothetical protein
MSDRLLAYLVSVVIMMAGAIWIAASGHSAVSALYIAIGIPTIVVGWVSFLQNGVTERVGKKARHS